MILVKSIDRNKLGVHTQPRVCIAQYKKKDTYQDSVKTLCGYYVTMPTGIFDGTSKDVTCAECIEKYVHTYI